MLSAVLLTTKSQFNLNTQKMNEDLKKELSQFAEELKKGLITNEDFEKKMKSFSDRIDALDHSEELKSIRKSLEEQGEALALIKKGAPSGEASLAAQIKAFIEDTQAIEMVKKGSKVSREFKMKEAATMFTSAAKPAINLLNMEVDQTIHSEPEEEAAIYTRLVKGATSSPTISWVNRKNKQGGAAWTAEGGLKPLMSWEYESETSMAKKAAVRTKVSTEMLTDAPFMRSEIDRLLRDDLMKKVNASVLLGTGEGAEIKGVTAGAAGYTATELNDSVQSPNQGDAIRAAILQLRLLNFKPDTLFINPVDKALIDLSKDSTGHYLAKEVEALIKGVTIVETANIEAGKFLLMDSSKWNVRVYEALRLEYGWANDDFEKNLVTVIAEMRLHSYQNSVDAGSVCYDSFATVMAAIEKAA